MISDPLFWIKEREAPLLRLNSGYLDEASSLVCIERAKKWYADLEEACKNFGSNQGDLNYPEWSTKSDEEGIQRIFVLDAERTFEDPANRRLQIETLCTIYKEVEDYHQGMAFVVAFMLLFLDKYEVVRFVCMLHRCAVPGYFKAAPVAYVRDAKVFEEILKVEKFEVFKRITDLVAAEAYCSKWFVGFNVHVLPFPSLADYFTFVVKTIGNPDTQDFQFRFAMGLIDAVESDIMATTSVATVLAILRLDKTIYTQDKKARDSDVPGSFFTRMIEVASEFIFDTAVDIPAFREKVLEEMESADILRQERLAKMAELSDDEIIFSDEEDDEEKASNQDDT